MAKIFELKLQKRNFKTYDYYGSPCEPVKLWAFDDDAKHIKDEPFLTEASAAISALVGAWATRALIRFSKKPFPGSHAKLTKLSKTGGSGTWYSTFGGREVWLCRVLKRYFWLRPKVIYASAEVTFEG